MSAGIESKDVHEDNHTAGARPFPVNINVIIFLNGAGMSVGFLLEFQRAFWTTHFFL